MSKLNKALDKARIERDNSTLAGTIYPTENHTDKLSKAYEKASKNFKDLYASPKTHLQHAQHVVKDLKPVYTQTQVVTPPENILRECRILPQLYKDTVHDSYIFLWTQILQRCQEKGWNSLMISSAHPSEGKTLTAINLAMTIAREVSLTSLLVEANFRNPKLCTYFGLDEQKPGLSDYLVNGIGIQDILFSPNMDKLVILPAGNHTTSHTRLLSSPKMKTLVQEFKTKYHDRYIIYDCPHILEMPDSLTFSSYVDAVLLIVESGKTTQNDIQNAINILKERDVNMLGIVLNKSKYN